MSVYSQKEGFRPPNPYQYDDIAVPVRTDMGVANESRTIKEVGSIGLATAEAKQKPSPWTKSMFKVRYCFVTNGFGLN